MKNKFFSNKDLANMIIPLFFEQMLVMLVGLADTFFISSCGEAAVSGVSLVNQFNTIFIYLFTALASGGAVVVSQYIGNKDKKQVIRSSSQLLMFSIIFSIVLSVLVIIFKVNLLHLLFSKVEGDVMAASITYIQISAFSYPFIAIYNAGASLCRSMGDTRSTFVISFISNIINIIGNYIGVFILHAGVAGVAYPSLIARAFTAVAITLLCTRKEKTAHYEMKDVMLFDGTMLKRILSIAIPNGVENGIFQLVKVALSTIVALFGTYQIAANGVAQSIWSLAALCGSAMGPVFITVIGQCMGASDLEQARYYFKKLLKISLAISITWNIVVYLITPVILPYYHLSDETVALVIKLVIIHNIFNSLAFPFSGSLGNGLRAAGDVKFTMIVSIASTVLGRAVFSYIFGIVLNMGVIGIAFAMCLDWSVRGIIFIFRYRSGKWTQFKVI